VILPAVQDIREAVRRIAAFLASYRNSEAVTERLPQPELTPVLAATPDPA
jgi:hypothetical protein